VSILSFLDIPLSFFDLRKNDILHPGRRDYLSCVASVSSHAQPPHFPRTSQES
jgi:hypothetical protein